MKLTVDFGARSYDIIVKQGALARAGRLANLHGKVLVVTDGGVPQAYIKTLLQQCTQGVLLCLPQGETAKSAESWHAIVSRLLEGDFSRDDAIAAIGGGTVGDVAGFAAATYLRGISLYQFPTTTMAQVDAAIGGFTALNLGGVKNVLGAFHQPRLVVADPDTLATLPPRHYANGLAEALKVALTGSPELFDTLEHAEAQSEIERIIYLALRYKKEIIERDETDQGDRRFLDFGHTIGHAIEAASLANAEKHGGQPLLHGECVALGMLPMIENRSLVRRTKQVMQKLGLPLKNPCQPEDILHYIRFDKKRTEDRYPIIRVKAPGRSYLETVPFEELDLLIRSEL